MDEKCRLCGSGSESVYNRRFADIGTKNFLKGYDVAVCRECGFVFAGNIPEQQDFDRYYRDMSIYDGEVYCAHMDSKLYNPTIRLVKKYQPERSGSILELGCAMGGTLAALAREGYDNVLGVDPSPACIEYINTHWRTRHDGVQGICASIGTIPSSISADTIVMISVIEHIRDLHDAMTKITETIRDGGLLILEGPNLMQAYSGW